MQSNCYPKASESFVEQGKFYRVDMIKAQWNQINKPIWVPVIGPSHSEHKSSYIEHIHVDERFIPEKLLSMLYKDYTYVNRKENIVVCRTDPKFIFGKKEKVLKCFREVNYDIQTSSRLQFYKSEEIEVKQLNLNCKICPHRGGDMTYIKPINGVLVCPLHLSRWCSETGKYLGGQMM